MKKFVLNADDLGLSPLTTAGVLECFRVVKSASLMITSDTAEGAFKQAKERGISVGIHLNVSGEGNFINQSDNFGKSGVVNKSYKNKEPVPDNVLDGVFVEFKLQLDLFKSKFKENPSHVNFHHPLYQIPNFTDRYKKFIEKVGLPTRWFRNLGKVKVPHPNHTEFRFFNENELTVENLLKIMEESPEGITEFVLHPGLLDKSLNSSYIEERQTQVDVLTNLKILEVVEKNEWSLISFDEIR